MALHFLTNHLTSPGLWNRLEEWAGQGAVAEASDFHDHGHDHEHDLVLPEEPASAGSRPETIGTAAPSWAACSCQSPPLLPPPKSL